MTGGLDDSPLPDGLLVAWMLQPHHALVKLGGQGQSAEVTKLRLIERVIPFRLFCVEVVLLLALVLAEVVGKLQMNSVTFPKT